MTIVYKGNKKIIHTYVRRYMHNVLSILHEDNIGIG